MALLLCCTYIVSLHILKDNGRTLKRRLACIVPSVTNCQSATSLMRTEFSRNDAFNRHKILKPLQKLISLQT